MRIVIVTLLALAGCSEPPRYAYRPTAATLNADAPATVDAHAAAGYPLPHGALEVTTIGVATVRPPRQRHVSPEPMVQVRLVVHDDDGEPWTVDPFEQVAVVGGGAPERPRFALCDGDDVAPAVLMPGETRTIDLFYAMRPQATPPTVSVDWRVRTPAALLARGQSGFDAHRLPAPPVPPPNPRQLVARALEETPKQSQRNRAAGLAAPGRDDLAGGLGH